MSRKTSGLFTCRSAIIFSVSILAAAFTVSTLTHKLSAGYSIASEFKTDVEIDGKYYGTFDQIKGLKDLAFAQDTAVGEHSVVTLNRDFVTDPSLYNWARETNRSRAGLKDVHLIIKDAGGNEVTRYVLKLCQPLSWTLEAADPTQGGFHESVDLAVQEVAIF